MSSQCETVPEHASEVSATIQDSGAQQRPIFQSAGESTYSPSSFRYSMGTVITPSVSAYSPSRAAARHGPPASAVTASSSAVCKASRSASKSSIAQSGLRPGGRQEHPVYHLYADATPGWTAKHSCPVDP